MENCYKLKPSNYRISRYYEPIKAFVVPAYLYVEGNTHENYWVDSQNLFYHVFLDDVKDGLIDGKKFWMISPYKPIGIKITQENEGLVKWLVEESTDVEDNELEWDFENHKPIRTTP